MDIQIATAPVSWGVLMKDTLNVPPYSVVLDQIQEAGYRGTELGPYGYLPFDVSRLRNELGARKLELISAFTIFNFLQGMDDETTYQEAVETVQVLSAMDCRFVVLSDALFVNQNRARRAGRIRKQDSLAEAEWDRVAQNVGEFSRAVFFEYGMKTVLHPHVGGYLETDYEISALLERTNPEYVGLCFDMAHIAYGGANPAVVLEQWGERTWYIHIKECSNTVRNEVLARKGDYFDGVETGVFPELGKGTIVWNEISELLKNLKYQGWGTVEQDVLPESGVDSLACARRNREFLRDTLGW